MISKLFNYMTTTKYLGGINRNDKYLLVFSNLIFVYIFYILYKKKKLSKKKLSKRLYLLIVIFVISSIYHFIQCQNHHNDIVDICIQIDVITCFIVGFILILSNYKKIDLKVILLLVISFLLLDKSSNFTEYIYCHSLWHILMGITLYLLLR